MFSIVLPNSILSTKRNLNGTAVFFYVSGLFAFWSLSIIVVIIGIVGVNLSSNSQTVLIISVFLISFGVFHKRYTDRKLYEKLCKKYKNESNSRIKGVIVVLVCLMSFCIFILSVMFEVGFFSKH